MDKALSAMCRDMTVLAHGKLCLAGSYALHRQLCEQGDFERAQWKPTDIDIFYSSGSGLDGDELRRRLRVMARRCQLQMLGVAAGDADESQSLYDAFSKRPYAPCLDDQDEARVAAFAREELMSLCSTEPSRSRQCARRRCARTRGRHWGDARSSLVLAASRQVSHPLQHQAHRPRCTRSLATRLQFRGGGAVHACARFHRQTARTLHARGLR